MADAVIDKAKRVAAIDQLRGYAIFGMLLVNASGFFAVEFKQLHHGRTGFTYADTIAPLFMFVVGMGMRLSWLRRSDRLGPWETRKGMIKRYGLLVLIGFAIYAGWLWDALMDIGLAGLLAVFLIDKKTRTRAIAAFGLVIAYQALQSFTSYGIWSHHGKFSLEDAEYVPFLVRLIPLRDELFDCTLNGGPLGPMSWCMMLLFGTVAYDMLAAKNDKKFILGCLAWGVGLCAAGFALKLEWPGVKEAWPFSARWMTAPFPLWASGLCFLQLVVFYVLCDKFRLRIPTFASVGMNPLFIYIIHSLFLDAADEFGPVSFGFAPESLQAAMGVVGLLGFYGVFAAVAYSMFRKNIFVKL
jgi:predicted acyltransferase